MSNTISKQNDKAVELFNKYLPPHLAKICVDAHRKNVKQDAHWIGLSVTITDLQEALTYCVPLYKYRVCGFIYNFTNSNYFDAEQFYTHFPQYRPEPETITKSDLFAMIAVGDIVNVEGKAVNVVVVEEIKEVGNG